MCSVAVDTVQLLKPLYTSMTFLTRRERLGCLCVCTGRDAGRAPSRRILTRQTQTDAVPLHGRQPVRVDRGLQSRLALQAERKLPGQTCSIEL